MQAEQVAPAYVGFHSSVQAEQSHLCAEVGAFAFGACLTSTLAVFAALAVPDCFCKVSSSALSAD